MNQRAFPAPWAAALVATLVLVRPAWGQGFADERTFPQSQGVVEKAVDDVRATSKGRLPTLDGFVGNTEQPLERYKNGFYDCVIKVSPNDSGGTTVRVSAKITAWYTDANPARSGYRTLPSNGRLETDLLDRLDEILRPAPARGASGVKPSAPPPTRPAPATASPDPWLPDRPAARKGDLPSLPAPGGARRDTPVVDPAASGGGAGAERSLSEQHERELRALEQNLTEVLRNQSHPGNLAAVQKSGTPVYARPQTGAQVLFSAEAQDEFQILEVQTSWVHVQISGASRGWIRRAQLELPEGFQQSPAQGGENATAPAVTFRVTRESVSKYPGDWPPLRGKTVKVFDVEPDAGMATSAREKRAFAKSLMANWNFEAAGGSALPAGVVVVFDSSDGGQISATLADLQQLRGGKIPEADFWRRCSLDPPESFEDRGKP